MRIGVDLMGGDSPPETLFKGVQLAQKTLGGSASIHVYATKDVVLPNSADLFQQKITVTTTKNFIHMDEAPLAAVRQKKDASIMRMLSDLAKDTLDVAISAGSTGALIGASTVLLPRLPSIRRSALLAVIPSPRGGIAVLDVGGFIEPRVEHLVQFARLGAAYQRAIKGGGNIRIGLLNIGSEELKGTERVKSTYALLQKLAVSNELLFVGNVEGRTVFTSEIDVLVTDGFSGNIFLKTVEGVSEYLFTHLEKLLQGKENLSIVEDFAKEIRYSGFAGALLAGFEKPVIKCHGYTTAKAMCSAIEGAALLHKKEIIPKMKAFLL